MAAGYSGTPLAKKLGIGAGNTVAVINEPPTFRTELEPIPASVHLVDELEADPSIVVLFVTERDEFEARLPAIRRTVFPNGSIWIAWPKKASKVPTDMTEDVVREVALPTGLVDNKVCAIDSVWSGLRLVWRKDRRTGTAP